MNERERIEFIMDSYGLTSSQFADKTGIPRASVSHILSGRNKPSLEVLQKVASVFPEVDLQWLMLGVGSQPQLQAAQQLVVDESVQEAVFAEEAQLFREYDEQMQSVMQPEPVRQPSVQPVVKREEHRPRPVAAAVSGQPRNEEQQRQPKISSKSAPQQRRAAMQRAPEQGRRIKEIRVFYSDGTFEILFPEK